MTKEELDGHKLQFEKALHFMFYVSRNRDFDGEDFKQLNWITRNLDRLRNHMPEELSWDENAKEVRVKC